MTSLPLLVLGLVVLAAPDGGRAAPSPGYLQAALGVPSTAVDAEINTGPAPSESFPFQERLDENFMLYWSHNATHIVFEMIVKTNGWVGFGITPNGAMAASDVVIGWVKDGQVHFADRHAEGQFLPARDANQDWTLLSGQEVGEYTVLKVVRRLETCDDQDRPVSEGTTRVIYAYSPADPVSEDAIRYHGQTRGTKSLLLLEPPASVGDVDDLPLDARVVDFSNVNSSVPSSATTYFCSLIQLPDLGSKHHMIRYEPVIQPGHENLVHHMLLYKCPGGYKPSRSGPSQGGCYSTLYQHIAKCQRLFIAWTIGGRTVSYPSHVGYPLQSGFYLLETHYDNPQRQSGLVDSSSLRAYVTSQLRQHDAGTFLSGARVGSDPLVPPGQRSFLYRSYCRQECLTEALGGQEIHVFANLLHSHLLGRKMRLRHFRNGQELPPIQEDNNYDFDYQETRMLKEERTIKAGDSLVIECDYDTTGRTSMSYGGVSTEEEMCVAIPLFYPAIELRDCFSANEYTSSRYELETYDWSDQSVVDRFKQEIADGDVSHSCWGENTSYQSSYGITKTPKMADADPNTGRCSD